MEMRPLKLKEWGQALSDVVFPPVCACCGTMPMVKGAAICSECLKTRFEPDTDDESILLPESVLFRFSLWRFDKMGYLQALLHKLKYHHIQPIGHRLGTEAGILLGKSGMLDVYSEEMDHVRLVPVPLHRKRFIQRGYNQARVIAEGVSETTGIPVIPNGTVVRKKQTISQTGLNRKERIDNVAGAFQITQNEKLSSSFTIIVDDVYTTGATTFELADTLFTATGKKVGIVTIART
jgi:ComF family protein